MRILYFGVLLVGINFAGGVIGASGAGITLDKIVLDSKWQQTDGLNSSLGFKADGKWPWLESNLSLKFRLPNTDSDYSVCDLGLIFPNISDDLTFDFDYQWNVKYRSLLTGFDYKLNPFEPWALTCGYSEGRRDPVPGYDSIYYYLQNRKQVGFSYHSGRFHYDLEFAGAAKNYPEAGWYTSERQTLLHGVSWKPNPRFNYKLGYQEATGNYPYDLSFTRSYWKETWTVTGEQKFSENFRWKWDYNRMRWDQGYRAKRYAQNIHMQFERQFNPFTSLQTDFILAEKIYSESVYYDPDEMENPDEELMSRCERKITVEYNHNFGGTSIGLGVYVASLDYYTDADVFKTGFFGFWAFKAEYWKVIFKAAPLGSLSSNTGTYQLKLEYDPNSD
jgi:hypothetical protein